MDAIRAWWRRTTDGLPPSYWTLWSGVLPNSFGHFVVPYLTIYLTTGRHFEPVQAGAVASVFALGTVVGPIAGGRAADRIGRRRTLVFELLASASTMMALGFVTDARAIVAVAFAAGVCVAIYRPAISAALMDLVAPSARGRAFGVFAWAASIGGAVGGVAAGALASRGYWLLFVVDAATSLLFAGVIGKWLPETRPEAHAGSRSGLRRAMRDRLLWLIVGVTMVGSLVYGQITATLPLTVLALGLRPVHFGIVLAVNAAGSLVLGPALVAYLSAKPPVAVWVVGSAAMAAGLLLVAFGGRMPVFVVAALIWSFADVCFDCTTAALLANLAPEALRGQYQGVVSASYAIGVIRPGVFGDSVRWKDWSHVEHG